MVALSGFLHLPNHKVELSDSSVLSRIFKTWWVDVLTQPKSKQPNLKILAPDPWNIKIIVPCACKEAVYSMEQCTMWLRDCILHC